MFIWDSANVEHVARHSVLPEEAEQVIANNPIDIERQIRNGEERIVHLGATTAGRILFVIVTPREEMLRVVTAFPADRQARKMYSSLKEANDVEDVTDP